jgi:hypothetical protein
MMTMTDEWTAEDEERYQALTIPEWTAEDEERCQALTIPQTNDEEFFRMLDTFGIQKTDQLKVDWKREGF